MYNQRSRFSSFQLFRFYVANLPSHIHPPSRKNHLSLLSLIRQQQSVLSPFFTTMASPASSKENVHFDHVLDHYVGATGLWQWRQYALVLLQTFASMLPFMVHIFSAYTPEHRCRVDICEEEDHGGSTDVEVEPAWTKFAIPPNEEKVSFLKEDQEMSRCKMFMTVEGAEECIPQSFHNETKVPCPDGYVYDRSIFQETITTRLDLVCGDKYKPKLLGSILMAGLIVGCLIGGPLGDKFGRRKTLIIAVSVLAPAVAMEGLFANYAVFATMRLVSFTCISIMWVCGHTLLMELFGQRNRKLAYVLNSLCFSATNALLALLTYLERNWRYMHLWIGLAVIATVPVLYFFLKESMRWLVLNGRENEAETMLLDVARVNKRHLSNTQCRDMREELDSMAKSAQESNESALTVLDMFKRSYLATTLISLIVWVTSVMGFYSLLFHIGDLAGNIFLNYLVSSSVGLPSVLYILFTIDTIGRRHCIIISQAVLGASCLAIAFVPKDHSTAILALYLVGKFGATCSISAAWFYTSELFPTNLRAQAVGTCSLLSRALAASASFVDDLSVYWEPLPMLVLGVPALVSAALVVCLPETKGKELQELARERTVKAVAAYMEEEEKQQEEEKAKNEARI